MLVPFDYSCEYSVAISRARYQSRSIDCELEPWNHRRMSTATSVCPAQYAAAYNGIGRLYDIYWRKLPVKLMPALDSLLFRSLPRGARVLDLCCGTGALAAYMCRRGLRVVGIDGSEDMLHFARRNAPEATFVMADARRFELKTPVEAVISTGDSMNHMLTPDDLTATFRSVYAALVPGGRFIFDMNMAEAFETQWQKSSTDAHADHLLYVRGRYDRKRRLGTTDVTVFSKHEQWIRFDVRLFQRCYAQRDVVALLRAVGFSEIAARRAGAFGIRGRLAVGRTLFTGAKPNKD